MRVKEKKRERRRVKVRARDLKSVARKKRENKTEQNFFKAA